MQGCICVKTGRFCVSCQPSCHATCLNQPGQSTSTDCRSCLNPVVPKPAFSWTSGQTRMCSRGSSPDACATIASLTQGNSIVQTPFSLTGALRRSQSAGHVPPHNPPFCESDRAHPCPSSPIVDPFLLPKPEPLADPVFSWGILDANSFLDVITSAYAETVHWRRNTFPVPCGSKPWQVICT